MRRQSKTSSAQIANKQTAPKHVKNPFDLGEIITYDRHGNIVKDFKNETIKEEPTETIEEEPTETIEEEPTETIKEEQTETIEEEKEDEDDGSSDEEDEEDEEEEDDEDDEEAERIETERIAKLKREAEEAERAFKDGKIKREGKKNIKELRKNRVADVEKTIDEKNEKIALLQEQIKNIRTQIKTLENDVEGCETEKNEIIKGAHDDEILKSFVDVKHEEEAKAKALLTPMRKIVDLVVRRPPPTPPAPQSHAPQSSEENGEVEPKKEPRARHSITRPPLRDVIVQKTEFRTTINRKEFRAETDESILQGRIKGDGVIYDNLNKWVEGTYKLQGVQNKTKRSVYECVDVLYKKEKQWYKLGLMYDGSGTKLNPL